MADEEINFPKACWICHRTEEEIREVIDSLPDGTWWKEGLFEKEIFGMPEITPENPLKRTYGQFFTCPICEMIFGSMVEDFIIHNPDLIEDAYRQSVANGYIKEIKHLKNLNTSL